MDDHVLPLGKRLLSLFRLKMMSISKLSTLANALTNNHHIQSHSITSITHIISANTQGVYFTKNNLLMGHITPLRWTTNIFTLYCYEHT